MDEDHADAINTEILEDLASIPKGTTSKSSRNLRTITLNNFTRDAFGGDFCDFGRPYSTGRIFLLSYPPKKLPRKLFFSDTIDDANHQDFFNGPLRAICKIKGE